MDVGFAVLLHYSNVSVLIEIEERRLKLAIEKVKTCKLENYVEIKNENILTSDISSATIALCYLFQDAMEQIGKTLRQRLQPGTKKLLQFSLNFLASLQSWKPGKIYKPAVKDYERFTTIRYDIDLCVVTKIFKLLQETHQSNRKSYQLCGTKIPLAVVEIDPISLIIFRFHIYN